MKIPMNGRAELERAANLFANCRESFNDLYTAEQLLQLWRMFKACGWDITPDRWEPEQVEQALAGVVPEFEEY